MPNGRIKFPLPVLLVLIGVFMFCSCAPSTRKPIMYNAKVVTAQEGDTLPGLAKSYLSDPAKSYIIAGFNNKTAVAPGEKIIVPLIPLGRGGLKASGYQTVPVLRYKKFSEHQAGPSTITRRAFESQMELLKNQGYHVITIDQLIDFLEFKDQIPQKSVVITIDDGWKSFLKIAYPVLKKYRFPATLFVQTNFIGTKDALSWSELRYLSRNGLDIQCRSKTYRKLKDLRSNKKFNQYLTRLDNELFRSITDIKRELGKKCQYLAYPVGPTNPLLIAFAEKHGFRAGFMPGGTSNPFFVSNYRVGRSPVSGDDDLATYQRKLTVFEAMVLK